MKIGVFSNQYQNKDIIEKVFRLLINYDTEVFVQKEFLDYLIFSTNVETGNLKTLDDPEFDLHMAFSIGGDGTFLRTVSYLHKKNIPILGINTGRLGFLADISADEIDTTLDEILNGQYTVEERTQIKLSSNNKEETPEYALNEVAILKQDLASMITVTMYINGELLSSYEADGIIVATPTGSTAYSLSVGGAIMAPDTPNFIITAIAPHSLTSRPLVVGNSNIITLEVKSRSGCFLVSVDGRSKVIPANGTLLKIEKAKVPVFVVKRLGHTFYNTLRNKLKWGTDPRQNS
ncbi:MAG: NAD kinase [Dysgonomonas sp.]|nr:NAD kinase [Dysgonomonas sp.]